MDALTSVIPIADGLIIFFSPNSLQTTLFHLCNHEQFSIGRQQNPFDEYSVSLSQNLRYRVLFSLVTRVSEAPLVENKTPDIDIEVVFLPGIHQVAVVKSLRKLNIEIMAISIDSVFSHLACV